MPGFTGVGAHRASGAELGDLNGVGDASSTGGTVAGAVVDAQDVLGGVVVVADEAAAMPEGRARRWRVRWELGEVVNA